MSLPVIKYCPGTLAEGYDSYSPAFLRRMFNGKKVSHILPYTAPEKSSEAEEIQFLENQKRLSISGAQEKFSLLMNKNKLRLTAEGEQGTYILKPVPVSLKNPDQLPANEHLTMQIASQVYKIYTAENGLIFFKDESPAYITRRFDVKPDGAKWAKEDFASLSGRSRGTAGPDFKFEGSYEQVAALFQKFVPAWKVEIEKFFAQVVFNYLFSNGDAHLKNFALLETASGDYFMSPAYDLVNTRLHVSDNDFALQNGLFDDDFESDYFRRIHFRSGDDFLELARRAGIESNISCLKRKFGLSRINWRGADGFSSCVWSAVISYNLAIICK